MLIVLAYEDKAHTHTQKKKGKKERKQEQPRIKWPFIVLS